MMNETENINNLLENRATVESAEKMNCEECFEHIIFLLKDKDHEFSMGLETVLECLFFAIKNGSLPKLPSSWLIKIDGLYRSAFAFDEDLCYYDYNNTNEKRD